MSQGQLRRVFLFLLVFVLLTVGIGAAFSAAMRADCCVQDCNLCLGTARLQETIRVIEASVAILALLALLQLAIRVSIERQNAATLVILKARLNN